MSWKLIDRPKTVKATKSLIKQFVEMTPAPHDRPLSERRIGVYEKLLAAGQFRPVTWASALCGETEDVYRVNGKHTSILLSRLEKLPEFYVTVEEYECETLEDVAKLYATFDSNMQSRTARDIYLSFAATVPELANVSDKVICAGIGGVGYQKHGQGLSNIQAAERAEAVLDQPEFVLWLSDLLQGAPGIAETGSATRSKLKVSHLYRQPVVAAMFASWQKAKAAATEFWSAVRDETGPVPTSPDRKIARWLVTSSLTMKANTRVRKAGTRETYVKCLHAWNAWRKGESTNLNYHADAKVPAVA